MLSLYTDFTRAGNSSTPYGDHDVQTSGTTPSSLTLLCISSFLVCFEDCVFYLSWKHNVCSLLSKKSRNSSNSVTYTLNSLPSKIVTVCHSLHSWVHNKHPFYKNVFLKVMMTMKRFCILLQPVINIFSLGSFFLFFLKNLLIIYIFLMLLSRWWVNYVISR